MNGPLNDSQEQIWRSWVMASRRLLDQLSSEMHDQHGLSLSDYEILVRLHESPDNRMRMSELADASLSSRSRLSHQIDRMQAAGYVSREKSNEDRRGLFASLTKNGARTLNTIARDHTASIHLHFFDVLSGREAKTLGKLSEKLEASVSQASD